MYLYLLISIRIDMQQSVCGVRSPAGAKYFSSILCVQTGSGEHPASCTMGTGGPFTGGKARPGRDADHSPPPSAEVVNEELYLLSPQAPPWRLAVVLYFFFTFMDMQQKSSYIWTSYEQHRKLFTVHVSLFCYQYAYRLQTSVPVYSQAVPVLMLHSSLVLWRRLESYHAGWGRGLWPGHNQCLTLNRLYTPIRLTRRWGEKTEKCSKLVKSKTNSGHRLQFLSANHV
jgi:hypothetical protein